ncbi:three-Cys-motif partner protein TcmP [Chloroflexales bacterium ZM16-3]|nr:three-Cys-motif partner protein TcmP [Chloroflexales bacterium ZM16-3]
MPPISASSHFKQLNDWSGRKHAILREYLPAFCRALSQQARGRPIWYVDGYAGAGVYRNPDNQADIGAPGSPVLAAHVTQELDFDVRCLNVEEDDENFESLQRETASYSHVRNIHADFNSVLDRVLATARNSSALFFLDSFGTKELPMDGLVDRIALRTQPTDILLRYATSAVRRLAANFEKDAQRGDANARNLDRWFRGDGWRSIIEQLTGNARDEALLEYYLQQLTSISNGRLRFSRAYPIRSTEGITKYHLVFATGNRLGLKLMSDVLCKAEAQYRTDVVAHKEAQETKKLNGQMSLELLGLFDTYHSRICRAKLPGGWPRRA